MNTTELMAHVAEETGIRTADVRLIQKTIFDVIERAVASGDTVWVREFGKFEPRDRRAVTRRNPKSGAPVRVPEKISMGLVLSPELKKRINPGVKTRKL